MITPVVAACIVRNYLLPTYLLHKKDWEHGVEWSGVWELPGGKIEDGESPEEALYREIWEELGIAITVGKLVHAQVNTYGEDARYLVLYYVCRTDCTGIPPGSRWCTSKELVRLDCLPGTYEAVDEVVSGR